MTLLPIPHQLPLDGTLHYLESEHSFTFDVASPADLQERAGSAGMTSLAVGTLQIEFAIDTGTVLFVWGLHPRAQWTPSSIGNPAARAGGVKVETSTSMQRGVSLRVAEVAEWTTEFDEETGWLRVAKETDGHSQQEILVATGVVLGLTDCELDAVWLQPVMSSP
jgi:hypothetical protein